jgi:hypothetical protein
MALGGVNPVSGRYRRTAAARAYYERFLGSWRTMTSLYRAGHELLYLPPDSVALPDHGNVNAPFHPGF